MSKITGARLLAELGFFGTLLLTILWQSWLSVHPQLSSLWLTLLWCIPLLFPLKGILQRKPYTHAWSSFIACLYLTHGLVQFYTTPDERLLASLEVALVCVWLVGSILYARWQGQHLGLGLKKRKQGS